MIHLYSSWSNTYYSISWIATRIGPASCDHGRKNPSDILTANPRVCLSTHITIVIIAIVTIAIVIIAIVIIAIVIIAIVIIHSYYYNSYYYNSYHTHTHTHWLGRCGLPWLRGLAKHCRLLFQRRNKQPESLQHCNTLRTYISTLK